MAHALFSENYKPNFIYFGYTFYMGQERLAGKTRLSIFLIIGACASVAALLWSGCVLWRHRKSGDRISARKLLLLLSDLLELLLDPYIVSKLLQDQNCWDMSMTCRTFVSFWSAARNYGLHLNAVVVLESVLSIRHPFCSAHVFFPSCSIVFSIVVFIWIFLCEFFTLPYLYLLSLPLLLAMIAMTWIVTCRTPPLTDETSHSTRKPHYILLGFVMFIVVPYIAYIILHLFLWDSWEFHVMANCQMSLRIISDPFLCMFVYCENLSQTPQTHTGHNPATEMTPSQNPDDSRQTNI